MAKKTEFPRDLYVIADPDQEVFFANESLAEAVDSGDLSEFSSIGVYKLDHVIRARKGVEVEKF